MGDGHFPRLLRIAGPAGVKNSRMFKLKLRGIGKQLSLKVLIALNLVAKLSDQQQLAGIAAGGIKNFVELQIQRSLFFCIACARQKMVDKLGSRTVFYR